MHCGHCHHQFDGSLPRTAPAGQTAGSIRIHTVPSACATQQLQHSAGVHFTSVDVHGEAALPGFRLIDAREPTSGLVRRHRGSTGVPSAWVLAIFFLELGTYTESLCIAKQTLCIAKRRRAGPIPHTHPSTRAQGLGLSTRVLRIPADRLASGEPWAVAKM